MSDEVRDLLASLETVVMQRDAACKALQTLCDDIETELFWHFTTDHRPEAVLNRIVDAKERARSAVADLTLLLPDEGPKCA